MLFVRAATVALLLVAVAAVIAPSSDRVEADPAARVVSATPVRSTPAAKVVVTTKDKSAKRASAAPAKNPLILPAFSPIVGALDPRVREGYELAAWAASERWPGCGMRWTILAGLGSVESGNGAHHDDAVVVTDSGVVLPRVIGPPLDGSGGRSLITDTDGGLLDGDAAFDHAVGPLQFIPSTWKRHGLDANGDGVADPHSIDDAALSAASYLCSAGNLDDEETLRRALFSYNHSDEYVETVRAQIDRFDLEFGFLVITAVIEDPTPPMTEAPTTEAPSTTALPTTTEAPTTTAP